MKISRYAMVLSVAAFGLGLAGCESQAQKEIKQQAKAIDESAKADANLMEAQAVGSPEANQAHAQAEALRNEGEQTKKHLDKLAAEAGKDPKP